MEGSRDIRAKIAQTRAVGIITEKIHSYTLFIETLLLERDVGLERLLLFVLF